MAAKVLNQSVGRRKRAVARATVRAGKGNIIVNGVDLNEFFKSPVLVRHATVPLDVANVSDVYDISIRVEGGGVSGQAGAIRLAIARAIVELDEDQRRPLKSAGLLTRDPREKERRKYGLKKARKASQFSKR